MLCMAIEFKKKLLFIILIGLSFEGTSVNTDSLKNTLQGTEIEKIKNLNSLSKHYQFEDPQGAYDLALSAYQLSQENYFSEGKTNALFNMGISAMKLNNYPLAIIHFNDLQQMTIDSVSTKLFARALSLKADAYYLMGDFLKAINTLFDYMKYSYQINNMAYIAEALRKIGNIYAQQMDYDKAKDFFNESLTIATKLNDKSSIAAAINNIGVMYKVQGNYIKALDYLEQALRIKKKINDNNIASTLGNIGDIYFELAQPELAIQYHKKSLLNYQARKHETGIAISMNDIGFIYQKIGNHLKAREYFEKSLAIALKYDLKPTLRNDYHGLFLSYAETGNFQKAFEFQSKYIDINEEIFNITNARNLAEVQSRFEIEQKEKEISLLRKDKEIQSMQLLKRQKDRTIYFIILTATFIFLAFLFFYFRQVRKSNKVLNALNQTLEERVKEEVEKNREKDYMLSIQSRQAAMGEMIANIAHQWRQPLNAIGIIVQNFLEAYNFNELNKEYLENKVKKAMTIINYMSQTIDDFRSYFKSDKAKQTFYINEVIEKAISFIDPMLKANNIKLEVNVGQAEAISANKNELTQVIVNILGNAKDAIIENEITGGLIKIDFRQEKEKNILQIFNNGGNITNNHLEKIFEPYFSTKTDRQGTGLGLYMSKTIIEKNMGGSLVAENKDDGVVFVIVLT